MNLPWHARVPMFQLKDSRVSRSARFLFAILAGHANQEGVCSVSLSKIAKDEGVSRRSVTGWKKELENCGWLSSKKLPGSRNIYTLVRNPEEIHDPLVLTKRGNKKLSQNSKNTDGLHEKYLSQDPDKLASTLLEIEFPIHTRTDENSVSHKHNNNINNREDYDSSQSTVPETNQELTEKINNIVVRIVGKETHQQLFSSLRAFHEKEGELELWFNTRFFRDEFEKRCLQEVQKEFNELIRLVANRYAISSQQDD